MEALEAPSPEQGPTAKGNRGSEGVKAHLQQGGEALAWAEMAAGDAERPRGQGPWCVPSASWAEKRGTSALANAL